jgi:hypothetical protein
MIANMEPFTCAACGTGKRTWGYVRFRPMRVDGGWVPDESATVARVAVCEACESWLAGLVASARGFRSPVEGLFGAPSSGGRRLVFEDQCQVCCEMPGGAGSLIETLVQPGSRTALPRTFACVFCAAWLFSLATDGRSARERASREIDGPYGDWPHANLRELFVEADVVGRGVAETIAEACRVMEVPIAAALPGSVLFIEASSGGRATRAIAAERLHRRAILVVAPISARGDLFTSLAAGATNWLTAPLTPQQVSAALGATLPHRLPNMHWDPVTALPIARLEGSGRPALAIEPAGAMDPFEVAWLTRRFSRGYDQVVSANGRIVLLPRATEDQIELVRERLTHLLGGRCTITPFAPEAAPVRRIDAAG